MKKRLLNIFLVMTMVLSFVPAMFISAGAETVNVESTNTNLGPVVWGNGEYVVATDSNIDGGVLVTGDSVKLTLNEGCTLTINGNAASLDGLTLGTNSNLTIEGKGSLIVNGANIGLSSEEAGAGIRIVKGAKLVVNGGAIETTGGVNTYTDRPNKDSAGDGFSVDGENAEIKIIKGSFEANGKDANYSYGVGGVIENGASLEVGGGNIASSGIDALYFKDGSFSMTGGELTATGVGNGVTAGGSNHISISGGKLNFTGGDEKVVTDASDNVSISGGVFNVQLDDSYLAEGYKWADNDDNTTKAQYPYLVKSSAVCYIDADKDGICSNTDVKYSSVQAAVNAAGSTPSNIVMFDNSEENVTIASNSDITLDINGHVLKAAGKEYGKNSVIKNEGTLTIKDSNNTTMHCFQVNTEGLWTWNDNYISSATNISSLTDIPGTDAFIAVPGGCITGGEGNLENGTYGQAQGGGILNKGNLVVCGVNIVGNVAGSGGGVYNSGELVIGTDTSIVGNQTIGYGAGISSNTGTLTTVANPLICYNVATIDEWAIGGGVYIESGQFSMQGETIISYNRARDGGGVCLNNNGTMTSSGGSITDNTAGNLGGGIFVASDTNCYLSNTTITKNTATANGGGIYVGGTSDGCFIEGTKITMADGSVKNIEDVKNGEIIRTFDHDTGELSTEKVINKFVGEGKSTAMMLHFEDNIELGIVGAHGLLEKESKKYVALSASNAEKYIGKYFYNADSAKWEKLLSVSYTSKSYTYYAFYSAHHIDAIANHMLSVTDDALFRLNVFDFDENLKVDQQKKQQDIEKYGLTSYEDVKDLADEETFYNGNNQYDHIAVCKGLITREELIRSVANTTNDDSASLQGEGSPLKLFSTLLGGSGTIASASLTLGENVIIKENSSADGNNVYLVSGKLIELNGVSTPTSLKMADPGQFTTNGTATDIQYFNSENEGYKVAYNKAGYLELVDNAVCKITCSANAELVDKKYDTISAALSASEGNKATETNATNPVPTVITMIDNDVENVTIANDRSITLDLNGYVLKPDNKNKSIITNNGALTIIDTNENGQTHYFTVGDDDLWNWNDDNKVSATDLASLTNIPATGTNIAVSGGCITGSVDGEGAIENKGNLTLTAGNIIGNKGSNAAGVYNNNGKSFIMDGGCIVGNINRSGASGVRNSGEFSFTDGTIAYNTVTKNVGVAGIWNDEDGNLNMIGGRVIHNQAMEDVYCIAGVLNEGSIVMTGGSISDNIAGTYNIGGIYDGGELTIGGTASITRNTIDNSVASNCCVMEGCYISIATDTNAPSGDMKVGISLLVIDTDTSMLSCVSGPFTQNCTASDTDFFTSDNGKYKVAYNSEGEYLELVEIKKVCYIDADKDGICSNTDVKYDSVQKAVNAAGSTPSNIVMLDDSEENVTIASDSNITIDLNGFVLKAKSAGSVITNNGTLTIKDSDAETATHYFKVSSTNLWELQSEFSGTEDYTYDAVNGLKKGGATTTDIPKSGKVIKVYGGAITGGVGINVEGGGIYSNGELTIDSGSVVGNTTITSENHSAMGGGIYSLQKLTMDGGSIIGNTVSGDTNGTKDNLGGGLYSGYECVMNGGNISYNKVSGDGDDCAGVGGGVSCFGKFKLNAGTIAGNSADLGGGIHVMNCTTEIFAGANICNNIATNVGGGIFSENGTVTIVGGNIEDNEAPRGGGIYNAEAKLSIIDSTINGNKAMKEGSLGGGICNFGGMLTIKSTTINNNETRGSGGGIYTWTTTDNKVEIGSDTNISNNKAQYGGGIYNSADFDNNVKAKTGNLTIASATISGNVASGTKSYGGGIYNLSGMLTIKSATIENNETSGYGGGIYTWTTTENKVEIGSDTNISNNKAQNGGGIYNSADFSNSNSVAESGNLTITKATISDNEATGTVVEAYGGGIYNDSGMLTINATTIKNNVASGTNSCGGGVYTWTIKDANVEIGSDTNISNNKAQWGGGIYNSAYYEEKPISNTGHLAITSATIIDNKAIGNGSDSCGGGIYNDSGMLTIMATIIQSNETNGSGGGIYTWTIKENKVEIGSDTNISNNEAQWGGGIYNDAQGSDDGFVAETGNLTITNVTISGNIASGTNACGGGVCNNSGMLTIKAMTIQNNETSGSGGGVYCWNGGKVVLDGKVTINDNKTKISETKTLKSNLCLSGDTEQQKVTIGDSFTIENNKPIGVTVMIDDVVSDGDVTEENSKDYSKCFSSDSPEYIVFNTNNNVVVLGIKEVAKNKDTGKIYSSVQKAVDEAGSTRSNIVMLADSEENVTIASNSNITLDLNGHVLSGDGTSSVITNEGKLTVTDTNISATHYFTVDSNGLWVWDDTNKTSATDIASLTNIPASGTNIAVKGGCITGGNATQEDEGGGVTNNNTFILHAGSIVGNNTTGDGNCYGGGVLNKNDGIFTMNGGCIVGNQSLHGGAGVYNYGTFALNNGSLSYNSSDAGGGGLGNHGAFIMKDGCIINNTAGDEGGGIYDGGGSCTLYGGIIKNNNAAKGAGGVKSGPSCTIGGNIKITGNKANNVVNNLTVTSDITLATGTNAVSSGTNVGVTILKSIPIGPRGSITISEGRFTTNGAGTDVQYFSSDNDAYYVRYNAGGYLELSDDNINVDEACERGEISVDDVAAATGSNVTITATPTDGYEVDTITVKDASGTNLEVATGTNGTFTFTMPTDTNLLPVTVSATFKEKSIPTPTPEPGPVTTSYTVSFDTQGHGTAPANMTIVAGGKVKEPDALAAEGYVFGGWFKDAECNEAWDFGKDTVSKDTKLYAKWTEAQPAQAKDAFVARGTAKKASIALRWNKVAGAKTYKVFYSQCGKNKYKSSKVLSAQKFTKKLLKRKTAYKLYVAAYDEAGKEIAKTPIVHIMTAGGKRSNATKVSATEMLMVSSGKSSKIEAKIAAKDSKKKLLSERHVKAAIRYFSADESIATVDADGNVKGVKAGTVNVYAMAPSGAYAVTKIVVE